MTTIRGLVIATDVSAVFLDWRMLRQRAICETTLGELARHDFQAWSIGEACPD